MKHDKNMAKFSTMFLMCLLASIASCEPSSAAGGNDRYPDFQDAGNGWPAGDMDHDDGDASQGAGDGGADAGSDAGPGWDSSTEAACMEVGGDYVVTGTCPGLPQAGTVEQTGCALAFSQALGAVIGETGTIEGQVVTTVHCSGLAMTSDGVRIDLTCQANQASCEAALRSPETSTF